MARLTTAFALFLASTASLAAEFQTLETPQAIGLGDGRIHIIPSLSQPSVKNGEKLTISAVIKAQAGVQSVTADIGGIETITLKPAAQNLGGVNALGTLGIWSAEWVGRALEEKYYTVALKVVDSEGHEFIDKSLQFSDPIVGLTTPGSTNYQIPSFSRVGAVPAVPDESNPQCTLIDSIHGYAYFGTYTSPGAVIKVALGAGNTPPTRIGTLTLDPGENLLFSGVIDAAGGYAYFGTYTNPGTVVKVALGAGNALPTRVGALTLNAGESSLYCAVIDSAGGYAYFGTFTSTGMVIKVALGAGSALPSRVGTLQLTSEGALLCGVIDAAAGYAYFGAGGGTNGIVLKVALGAGNALPTRVGAISLNAGETTLSCGVIDPVAGYAYFGVSDPSPGVVVKVSLGAGGALPVRIGALTLNAGENQPAAAAIDAVAGTLILALRQILGSW